MSTEDDRDMDNIVATSGKETGIDKDIILANVDKVNSIGRVENGKQLRIVKFTSDHFKEDYKKHKQRKKDNATKRNKNNQPAKIPMNLQPFLTKYRIKLLQFAGKKFEGIQEVKFVFADMHMATLRLF